MAMCVSKRMNLVTFLSPQSKSTPAAQRMTTCVLKRKIFVTITRPETSTPVDVDNGVSPHDHVHIEEVELVTFLRPQSKSSPVAPCMAMCMLTGRIFVQ